MPGKKISELTAATSISSADQLPIIADGVTKKVSTATLLAGVNAAVSAGSAALTDAISTEITDRSYAIAVAIAAEITARNAAIAASTPDVSAPIAAEATARDAAIAAAVAVEATLRAAISASVGAANGIASLDDSGQVPIGQIPPAALERLVLVADQAARFALTSATVQLGDTVKQDDNGDMYFVKDIANLDSAAGYTIYTAGTASAVAWSGITSKPTTLSGYGISDAATNTALNAEITARAAVSVVANAALPAANIGTIVTSGTITPANGTTLTNGGDGSITSISLSDGTWIIYTKVDWQNTGAANAKHPGGVNVFDCNVGSSQYSGGDIQRTSLTDSIAISGWTNASCVGMPAVVTVTSGPTSYFLHTSVYIRQESGGVMQGTNKFGGTITALRIK